MGAEVRDIDGVRGVAVKCLIGSKGDESAMVKKVVGGQNERTLAVCCTARVFKRRAKARRNDMKLRPIQSLPR